MLMVSSPHNGAPRQIQPTQRIHRSVFEAMGINTDTILLMNASSDERPPDDIYTPLARFGSETNGWDDIRTLVRTRLEDDPWASVNFALKEIERCAANLEDPAFQVAIEVLKGHVSVSRGLGASLRKVPNPLAELSIDVSDLLISTLEKETQRAPGMRVGVIDVILSALLIVPPNEYSELQDTAFRNIALAVQADEHWKSTYSQVVKRHGSMVGRRKERGRRECAPSDDEAGGRKHDAVYIVTISADKRFIASGSALGIIHMWDPETGQDVHGKMRGHTGCVN
ncbi:hypothetical protein EYR36_003332 [Pleurotus pulmonarius]|nr:hypothetical protein EYR36_003332 [Pleurotus pulmonarius]